MKFAIAICDDENTALEEEKMIITSVLEEKNISYTIDLFDNAPDMLSSGISYDVVFLDVEMEEMNGIDTARRLRDINEHCFIFFVTNHEAYLDEAFNLRAFRFWTKPIDRHKLIYGIDSALEYINTNTQYITAIINNEMKRVLSADIIYVYMENKRMHLVLKKGDIVVNNTYKQIYSQLIETGGFGEPCRGYCVNFRYIRKHTREHLYLEHQNKVYKLDISRRKYNDFRRAIAEWIGGK